LNDDFLARLQHFGNQLRALVLFVPRMRMLLIGAMLVVRAPTAASTALGTSAATHGPLEPGTRLIGNASRRRRLSLGAWKVFAGREGGFVLSFEPCRVNFLVEFFVPFLFVSFFAVLLFVLGFMNFAMLFRVLVRGIGGGCYVMHFIRDGIGFGGFVGSLVLGSFLLRGFSLGIGIQGFLQLVEFRGLDKRFDRRIESLGAMLGFGLCFLMLGFRKLFGEGTHFFF
jgi:hypothetical protein